MSSLTKSATPPPSTLPADDGTPISYYVLGSNEASKIIIVPGAMSSALSQLELGTALSATHTVYLLSRRARGLSGPYPAYISADSSTRSKSPLAPTDAYTVYDLEFSSQVLNTDLQDLAALMRYTGATNLMGISSGGLLVLAGLLTLSSSDSALKVTMPPITKAIIFDPPLFFSTPITTTTTTTTTTSTYSDILPLLRRYEHEMSSGATVDALLTAMRVSQMGPAWLAHVPRWILRPLTRKMLVWEAESQARKIAAAAAVAADVPDASGKRQYDEGAVTMQALAPALRYDFALCEAISLLLSGEGAAAAAAAAGAQRLASLSAVRGRGEVLFLGGELSPGYIKGALDVLADVMITGRGTGREGDVGGMKRVEIRGVGHELLENKVRNGKVECGVGVVEAFLEKGIGGVE